MIAFGLILGLCLASCGQGKSQNDTPGQNGGIGPGNVSTYPLLYVNQGSPTQSTLDKTATLNQSTTPSPLDTNKRTLIDMDENQNWGFEDDTKTNWGYYEEPTTKPPVKKELERLPWQVNVFNKRVTPHERICGGTFITNSAIISAASCFWREEPLPPAWFAVAAGEVLAYRRDDYGSHRQQSNVYAIKLTPRFLTDSIKHRDDISVLLLEIPFYSSRGMRPACVSFDQGLEEKQLRDGNLGTILEVGFERDKYGLSILRRETIPYISIDECRQVVGNDELQYLTEDKICAGSKDGFKPNYAGNFTRDIGSGLSFFLGNPPIAVPFLRGVHSRLTAQGMSLFTHVQDHKEFLLEHIKDLEETCGLYYPQLGMLLDEKPVKMKETLEFQCNCYC